MSGEGSLLTPRARVLLCVADDCDTRMRDIAETLEMTERSVYELLCQLVEDGYLTRERNGRRNCYRLHPEHAPGFQAERERVRRLTNLLAGTT